MCKLLGIKNALILLVLMSVSISVAFASKQKSADRDKSAYLLLESIRLEQDAVPDSLVCAFELLNRILEFDKNDSEALARTAPYYILMDKKQDCYENIVAAANVDTTNSYYNKMAATQALRIGDNTTALNICKRLIRNNPEDDTNYSMLAQLYLNMGKIEEAMACYDTIEYKTENIEYVAMTKANIYAQLNLKERMIYEIKRLSDAYPNNIDYLLPLASAYLETDSLEKNREIIKRIQSLGAGCITSLCDAEYYNKIGNADSLRISVYDALRCSDIQLDTKLGLLRDYVAKTIQTEQDMKSLQKTDALFLYLTETYPRETIIKRLYTDVLILQNKYDKVVEQCQASLYIEPDNMEVHNVLISAHYKTGDHEAMNNAIENAMQYADSTFYNVASGYYYLTNQFDRAISLLQEAAQKHKNSPFYLSDIYTFMGDIYYQNKQIQLSYEYYEKALKENPKNISTLNNYAYNIAISDGDLLKAEKMSALTIKAEPNNPVYLDTYGWIYFKQGNYFLASMYIKLAITNGGETNPEVLEHYGDVLYKQNNTEEALEYWNKALQAGSTNPKLKTKIETEKYIDNR